MMYTPLRRKRATQDPTHSTPKKTLPTHSIVLLDIASHFAFSAISYIDYMVKVAYKYCNLITSHHSIVPVSLMPSDGNAVKVGFPI